MTINCAVKSVPSRHYFLENKAFNYHAFSFNDDKIKIIE